jgi:methyl-accepting chemotaxis protein
MRLSISTPLSIIAGIGLALAAVAGIAMDRGAETVRWAKEKEIRSVAAQVDRVLARASRSAMASAELFAAMPGIAGAIEQDDMTWFKGLVPIFQHQRSKYGVQGITLLRLPARVAFRTHDPGRYGDDVSASRPMIVETSRLHESRTGLEVSSSGVAMRGVAPVFLNGTPVGLVEWLVGLLDIAKEIHEATDAEITFFIDRARLDARAADDRRVGPMAALASTDWEQVSSLLHGDDLDPVNEVRVDYRTWHRTDYATVQVPLFDFAGERIGTVVAVREINEFARAFGLTRAILVTASVAGTLVCCGLVTVVVRGRVLRPMARLADRATALANGDFSAAVPGMGRANEVGEHAEALETLRQSLLRRALPQAPGKAA